MERMHCVGWRLRLGGRARGLSRIRVMVRIMIRDEVRARGGTAGQLHEGGEYGAIGCRLWVMGGGLGKV